MNAPEKIDWLKLRQSGIGGSDVAAIVGLSPYRTPLDVYLSKIEEITEENGNEFTYWGTVLEDVVAKEFARRSGLKIQKVNKTMRHPEHDWMLANIDRAVVNPAISGNVRYVDGRLTTDQLLECKTASTYSRDAWGESGDAVPVGYALQVQWYLAVTGCSIGHMAVLIGGNDFRVFQVNRDDELIRELIRRCAAFWNDNVLSRKAPDPINAADVLKLYPQDAGDAVEAADDVPAKIEQLKELKEKSKALDDQIVSIETDIKASFAEHASLVWHGLPLATYKTQSRESLDSKALKAAHPGIYQQFIKTTSSRVLRIK